MPPPASFITINAIPFSRVVTQAEFNGGTFGGIPNEVWFQFITPVEIAFGGYSTKGGTFIPFARIYASDGTTLLHSTSAFGGSKSWYFVFPIGTYYVKITRFGGGASNFDFTSNFDTRPVLTSVPSGSIIVNDDLVGFPATVISRTTGALLGVLTQVPAGETASIFSTGESIWHHAGFPFGISILDSDLNLVISGINDRAVGEAALCRSDTDFYFFYGSGIDKITTLGAVTTIPLSTTLAQGNIKAVAMSPDGSILYYITGGSIASGFNNGIIKRWNILTDTAMVDFYAIPGFVNADGDQMGMTGNNTDNGNLLRLTDGSFVTHSYDASADLFSLLHISAAGVLLHKYDYPGYGFTTYGVIDHICHNVDDPASVIVWFFKDSRGDEARYATVRLSDGLLTVITDTDMFSGGINFHADSPIIFAPSNSCVHVLYTIVAPVIPPNISSGIYKLVPGKHNDTLWTENFLGTTDIKIP